MTEFSYGTALYCYTNRGLGDCILSSVFPAPPLPAANAHTGGEAIGDAFNGSEIHCLWRIRNEGFPEFLSLR